jgi:phosphoglycolate phosphatase-like HAD superfamily hydrolase
LVTVLSADRRSNVRWVGIDSLGALWRVRWTVAEARHHGFCMLDQPSVNTPGWFPVSSLQLAVADAEVFIGEGENPLRRAIEYELEPEQILPKTDESVSDETQVGLLLRPGPLLRRLHDSSEIAQWRRELVRAIRRDPERAWSRAEVAVFASLERDRKRWPNWLGQPKLRHSTEHFLRMPGQGIPVVIGASAAFVHDPELVARWGKDEAATRNLGNLREFLDTFELQDAPSVDEVLDMGHKLGWDPPIVARGTALTAEQLLDQPTLLRAFIEEVLAAALTDLGPHDRSLLPLIQIAAIATAIAGNPWVARDRLEEVASEWSAPVPFGPDYAAARTLCGEYTQAADLLRRLAQGDSPETRLYIAVLLAAGQPEQARAELERLIGEPRDPIDYLGDQKNANERARDYLRDRLHALAQS